MAYRRLPGKKRGFYRQNTLWLGDDHLLAVDSNYYVEEYRRFPYRDIQAIILRKTASGRNTALALLLPILLMAGGLVVSIRRDYPEFAWFWGILIALLLLVLLIHLVRGPTCACRIQVPLGIADLPSLHRRRTARKALQRLKAKIVEQQGVLAAEAIPATLHPRQPEAADIANLHSRLRGGGLAAAGADQPASVRIHLLLFSLLAGYGALSGAQAHWNFSPFSLPSLLLFALLLCLGVFALVRQNERSFPGGIKGLTWGTVVFLFLTAVVGYFLMIFGAMANFSPDKINAGWDIFQAAREVRPGDFRALSIALWLVAALSLSLALIGMLLLLLGQGRARVGSR